MMKTLTLILRVMFLVFIWTAFSEASPPAPKRVAVVPFEDLSGTSDLKWLSKGVAVTITSDLRRLPGLLILERAQLEAALSEVRLAQTGVVDEKTAAAAGRLIGADLLILGEYQEYGGNCTHHRTLCGCRDGRDKRDC
jgi:hypothetical protein